MTNAELSGFLAGYLGAAFPAERLGYAAGWLSKCAMPMKNPFGSARLQDREYEGTPETVASMSPDEYLALARQQMLAAEKEQRSEGTLAEQLAPAGPLPGVAPVAEKMGIGPVGAGLLGAGAAGAVMLAAYAIAQQKERNKYNVK